MEEQMGKVLTEYTDTAGVHHLIISSGDGTGDIAEYTSLKNCPFCGREFTEDMICECGKNNAVIRI